MTEGGTVRVREPGKHALYNPATQLHETPAPGQQFPRDHSLVLAHPWAFGTDEEIAAEQDAARRVTSVPIPVVEQATANPGEKRRVGRPRKDLDKA